MGLQVGLPVARRHAVAEVIVATRRRCRQQRSEKAGLSIVTSIKREGRRLVGSAEMSELLELMLASEEMRPMRPSSRRKAPRSWRLLRLLPAKMAAVTVTLLLATGVPLL